MVTSLGVPVPEQIKLKTLVLCQLLTMSIAARGFFSIVRVEINSPSGLDLTDEGG